MLNAPDFMLDGSLGLIWGILGLLLGSFANVCIYRLPRGLSIVYPPSHCPNCNHPLSPLELIPVFSWLMQRGRCKSCRQPIAVQYPIVELLSSALFLLAWMGWGFSPATLYWSALFWILLVVSFIDITHQLIPDSLLAAACICWLPMLIPQPQAQLLTQVLQSGLGALTGGGILAAVLLLAKLILRRDGLGWGDVKLMAVAGLYLGPQLTAVALMSGVYAGALTAVIMLAAKRWRGGMQVPFGPFLSIGIVTAALWGNRLLEWYFGFFW